MTMTPVESEPTYVTIAQQVVLKAMCETTPKVSTNMLSLIETLTHRILDKMNACITDKKIMNVY